MEGLTLGRLAEVVGAVAPAGMERIAVRGASTDTRTLKPGEVFFALRGERFDGAGFVARAFARGAAAAVVSRGSPAGDPGQPRLEVEDVRVALGALAAAHRQALGVKVVGVTGSAGKTTTKDMIHGILAPRGGVVCARKSFNNDVGVPLTLLRADASTRVVVLEIGTNHPGEIDALGAIAKPDVAVITCIGESHLEGLGSIEGVAREKLSLLRHLRPGGAAVLNGDDLRLRGAASALRSVRGRGSVWTCGFGAGLDRRGIVLDKGTRWRISTEGRCGRGPTLDLPVPGLHTALDALLAMTVTEWLGVSADEAARALASFHAPPGRLNVIRLRGRVLVDDTYNANPTSVNASLEAFASMAPPSARVAVLGTMHELGDASDARHRAVGRSVARMGVAGLVTVGAGAAPVAEGAAQAGLDPARVRSVESAADVADALASWLAPGVTVLFKASRACGLERAVRDTSSRLEGRRARAA